MRDDAGIPSFDGLRSFLAVCRRMSITAAGEDLHLTQSAVSRQIQALENAFGIRLFERGHRSLTLTAAGQSLRDLVEPWAQQLVRFQAAHGPARAACVTISASIGVTALWLVPRLAAFNAAHPDIDLRIAAHNRLVNLESEDIDLAIRYTRAAEGSGVELLFNDAIVPVAAPEIAEVFDDPHALVERTLIEFDDRVRPWLQWEQWLEFLGVAGRDAPRMLRFNHYDQVIQAALAGQGVALGRLPLVRPFIEQGRLVSANRAPQQSDYGYWLLRHPAPRDAACVVAGWLASEARADNAWLSEPTVSAEEHFS